MIFLVILFIILMIVVPFILYVRIYFRPVSTVYLSSESPDPVLQLVRPSRRWFRSCSGGKKYGFVHLGCGYYAFYFDSSSDKLPLLDYSGSVFPSEIYIFSRNRLGRFRSVDLSSRNLSDVIKKFVNEV